MQPTTFPLNLQGILELSTLAIGNKGFIETQFRSSFKSSQKQELTIEIRDKIFLNLQLKHFYSQSS